MANHQTIRTIIDAAGSQLVSVNFIKKDGTERQLTFNPQDFAEIKGTGNPTSDPNIFRIRDIKLSSWRSFDARRVTKITAKGQTTKLPQEA